MRRLSDLPPGCTPGDIDRQIGVTLSKARANRQKPERSPRHPKKRVRTDRAGAQPNPPRTRVMNEGYYGLSSRVLDLQHRVTQRYLSRVIDIAAAYENGIMREDEAVLNLSAAHANYTTAMLPANISQTTRGMSPTEQRRQRASYALMDRVEKAKAEPKPTEADWNAAREARKRGDKKGITALVQMRWRLERERAAKSK